MIRFVVVSLFLLCVVACDESRVDPVLGLSDSLVGEFCADEGHLGSETDLASRSCASTRLDENTFKVRFSAPRVDYPWSVSLGSPRGQFGEVVSENDLAKLKQADLDLLAILGLPNDEIRLVTLHQMVENFEGEKSPTRSAISIKTFVEHQIQSKPVFGDRFVITRSLNGAVTKLISRWHTNLSVDSASIEASREAAEADAQAEQYRGPKLIDGWFPVKGVAKASVALKLNGATDISVGGTATVDYYIDGRRLTPSSPSDVRPEQEAGSLTQ